MTACEARNGTYTCQRRPGHRDQHAAVIANVGRILRWGAGQPECSQPLAPVLEAGL